jgi:NAD-dependent DNA ligase/DNA polymerase/3'-5' exonuclease PolX
MPKSTKKNKKIIIQNSSSSSETTKSKKKRNFKSILTKTKKKRSIKPMLIIESSTSSLPELKEKIEPDFPEIIPLNKTNLKISPERKTMINTKNERLNEKFIELMEKLSEIMLKQGEPFRARAYQKAQETIMSYPSDITSPNDLKDKPGIGSTIMEKLNEFVVTGTLRILEREKTNPINILADVYGIGPKKAKELVDKGIKNIDQLKENQHLLNDVQKIGLQYYDDILKRIPRSEIDEFQNIFDKDFKKVSTPDSKLEIVGSYRRGAVSSGDIDVIITSVNNSVFINFIDLLIKQKIILEVLSRGQTKCLVIAKLPSADSSRRIDFLYTSHEEFPFAVLYFTGSKNFNTVMRHQALSMGLSMNEHGLYKMDGKKKGEKVDHVFHSEKDIFDYLKMEFKKPEERIDGRSVIIKSLSPKKTPLIIEDSEDEKETKKETKKKLIIESDSDSDSENDSENEEKEIIPINKEIIKIVSNFRKNGLPVLDKLNENELSSLLREAKKTYYNENPFLTDNEFDIVKEYMENKYPSNKEILEIGSSVERNKVELPYFMGSMDKIKPDTSALNSWLEKYKGPYIISCKLDGVSGLYTTEGSIPKLYTRGDGKIGQDISHLIPYLRLPKTKDIVIRGEFIIQKEIFAKKYKTKFANPRNMVAGIINNKKINESIKDIHFVSYELMKPILKPSEQIEFLCTLDVETVKYTIEKKISNDFLSQTLIHWREDYEFEIDGIIITNDKIYDRKKGNPEHSFAFKMVLSDQIAEAKVVDVIWTPSKDGYLKPRVQIEPIHLSGVKIEYATGFNGEFINENKIGVGAIIEVIRSGDVIPHIRKVVEPAIEAKMPSVPYKWNETHVDVILENKESDETVREKNITGFFRGIGVEGLSSGNVSRLVASGFDTIPKIIKMTIDDFLTIDGFKQKMASKLYNGVREKLESSSLITIMAASNIFGRGFSEIKLELIMKSYPDVLTKNDSSLLSTKISKVASIKGMALKTAESFVDKIPNFIQFMEECGLTKKLSQKITQKQFDENNPLFGKTIILTGFRDNDLQNELKEIGAKIGASVSKSTFVVIVKDLDEATTKVDDAKKLGIPIMSVDQFRVKYL